MADETTQLAAPDPSLDHLRSFFPAYINGVNANMSRLYNLPFVTVDPITGLSINGEPTIEDFQRLFTQLATLRDRSRRVATEMDRWIGQAVIDYSARHDVDWTTAISQLDLPRLTGRSAKTILKLPRIVSTLPDEIWNDCPNLTISHFDAATSFAGPNPTNTEEVIRFAELRDDMLQRASNAGTWTKNDIANSMRQIQIDLGVAPSRPEATSSIAERFRQLSVMLLDWEDGDFATHHVNRELARQQWNDHYQLLIERGVFELKDDVPGGFLPPPQLPLFEDVAQDAEVVSEEAVVTPPDDGAVIEATEEPQDDLPIDHVDEDDVPDDDDEDDVP